MKPRPFHRRSSLKAAEATAATRPPGSPWWWCPWPPGRPPGCWRCRLRWWSGGRPICLGQRWARRRWRRWSGRRRPRRSRHLREEPWGGFMSHRDFTRRVTEWVIDTGAELFKEARGWEVQDLKWVKIRRSLLTGLMLNGIRSLQSTRSNQSCSRFVKIWWQVAFRSVLQVAVPYGYYEWEISLNFYTYKTYLRKSIVNNEWLTPIDSISFAFI